MGFRLLSLTFLVILVSFTDLHHCKFWALRVSGLGIFRSKVSVSNFETSQSRIYHSFPLKVDRHILDRFWCHSFANCKQVFILHRHENLSGIFSVHIGLKSDEIN